MSTRPKTKVRWTNVEEATLCRHYELTPRPILERMLRRHTWVAINKKAKKLGLVRSYTGRYGKNPGPAIIAMKLARERRGIRQDVIAERMGYSYITLKRWETGVKTPTERQFADWQATLREYGCEVSP